ncbi:MFS transporter [SAR202 cluster bacterium AD-802-E10_MRT_200m]|nr:MFS transporter [SAR202 cluster bacterium AD-802-E10_MRT_200m]
MPFSNLYNTLTLRDFRLFWYSSSIHVIGEVATFIAQGWLVLSLTADSALWVGIASGIRGAGHISFALIGGILADRLKRRAILVNVSFFRAGIFAILATLIFNDHVELWHVLVIVFIQGAADGLMTPSFNGLIYDTVGPSRLMNAMAYILAAFHVSWAIGSILTGHLINSVGIGSAYALASIACLISIVPLKLMAVSTSRQAGNESIARNLVQGIQYVVKQSALRALLLLSMITEAFGFSYLVMLPVIAKNVLKVGPTGLGYLSGAGGIGALFGTVIVAALSDFKDKWKLLTLGTICAGVSILLFAISPWFAVSLVLVGCIGFSLLTYDATINTLLQTLSEDHMRGRVLGLYGMTWGFTPAGGFAAGSVASIAGAPFAVGLGAVIILTYTLGVIARMNHNRT